MNDWDINPSKYLTDSEGNFKLKADGTPRKKGGRPKGSKSRGYNFHSQTKAKLAARKQVRIKEKQIEQTRNKLNALRSSASTSKDVLAKLDNTVNTIQVKSNPQISKVFNQIEKTIDMLEKTEEVEKQNPFGQLAGKISSEMGTFAAGVKAKKEKRKRG